MGIIKKIATLLALFIGLMSVFAGSKVLLGIDTKDYTVITWLVIYNVVFGLISIVTAYFLWRQSKSGLLLMWFILIAHFVVFIYLKFISDLAANESKMAMLFRVSIWLIIVMMSFIIPKYFNEKSK